MIVVIHHNPQCGTSRNTLEMIRSTGIEPVVIEYLKTGWTKDQLQELVDRSGLGVRDLLRERGTQAAELGLTDPATSDEAILAAMILDPILVNRPIVVTEKGVALCRPPERVLDLL